MPNSKNTILYSLGWAPLNGWHSGEFLSSRPDIYMVHYKNGLFHKENGCAVILTNGDKE